MAAVGRRAQRKAYGGQQAGFDVVVAFAIGPAMGPGGFLSNAILPACSLQRNKYERNSINIEALGDKGAIGSPLS